MPEISHADTLDIRQLAELADECNDILTDEEADEDDLLDAKEVLVKLASLADNLNQSCDEEDGESVRDALYAAENFLGPTLIAESYFTEYAEELCKDIGDIPDSIPSYISNHIDWDGVAGDLRSDYTSVTFDGEDYLIR